MSKGTASKGAATRSKANASVRCGRAAVLWRALAAAAVVLLALLAGPAAAQAHDQLDATSPADGSTVAAVPQSVTLTMSNTPAAIGAQVKVLDAAGHNWAVGPVTVMDAVATQPIKPGAPAGKYTVQWRLVSSDSHPVEGSFTFTATAASVSHAGDGAAQPLQQVSPAAVAVAPVSGGIPWSVFGLIGVFVVLVVILVVTARRRLGQPE